MRKNLIAALVMTACVCEVVAQVPAGTSCNSAIPWTDASRYAGTTAYFSGPVVEVVHRSNVKGEPTRINIGRAYPDKNRMTLLVWGKNLDAFGSSLQGLAGRNVCATGTMGSYKGSAEMEITNPKQILVR